MPGTLIEGAQKTHPKFWVACKIAKVPPTTRQLRKWNREIGIAWQHETEAGDILSNQEKYQEFLGNLS